MRTIAPAKINLTLEVLGKRADGFHEIRSVMQTISLCDELEASGGKRGASFENADGRELEGDDLVVRAAHLLAGTAGEAAKGRVRLTKRIPVAAGLGGGSSDAAAVLRVMNRYRERAMSIDELSNLGANLGSDVPFFLYGGTALASGRGDVVRPARDLGGVWSVLLAPPISVAEKTKQMYAALEPSEYTDGERTGALLERIEHGRPLDPDLLCNAFERVAERVFPGIEGYRRALEDACGRRAHLCGAGPALFAPAEGEIEARDITKRLGGLGGTVYAVRTLTAGEATAVTDCLSMDGGTD